MKEFTINKLMGLSEAMKIGNFNIHGREKINGIFMKLQFVVHMKTLKGGQSPPEAF